MIVTLAFKKIANIFPQKKLVKIAENRDCNIGPCLDTIHGCCQQRSPHEKASYVCHLVFGSATRIFWGKYQNVHLLN
jgi:hypothetical protein